jgi:hypothetical protein
MSGGSCACPRADARDCLRFRVKDDMREVPGDEPVCPDDESCECACHVDDDGDFYGDDADGGE